MAMKRTLLVLVVAGTALLVAGGAQATVSPTHASFLIRHQVHGCHAWSVDGGAFKAQQTATLAHGGWITLTNNDVMYHKLVQTSGPAVSFQKVLTAMTGVGMHGTFPPAMLAYMGAAVNVNFVKRGVYRFTTKFGEDYKGMTDMHTIGEDNVLRLTVKVK